jgi:hypothetical protein
MQHVTQAVSLMQAMKQHERDAQNAELEKESASKKPPTEGK